MQSLEEVGAFIEQHLDRPLLLDDIAQQVHLSRFHFLHRFQRHFHETPHQYLIRKRLERAQGDVGQQRAVDYQNLFCRRY
jgi:AraC family transcriptional regulator